MKKKLLIVQISMYNGGAQRSLANFLSELDPERYEVDLLLFIRGGLFLKQIPPYVRILDTPESLRNLYYQDMSEDPKSAGIRGAVWSGRRVLYTALSKLIGKVSPDSGKYQFRYRQIRWSRFYSKAVPELKGKYDVVMSCMSCDCSMYVSEKVHADRYLTWVHNTYSKMRLDPNLEREYFKKFDGIATISEECARDLREKFPECADKIRILPNLVSERLIRERAEESDPDDLRADAPILLTVAGINYNKNPLLSVETAQTLKKRGVRFHWYWIGDGVLQEKVEAEIVQRDVSDCFHLLGVRENPYPYMKKADVIVQNSEHEGKSITLDEAKILGRPIVVTEFSTVHDQFKDDEAIITGFAPDEIADGIEAILTDGETANRLSSTLLSRSYGNTRYLADYIRWIEGTRE